MVLVACVSPRVATGMLGKGMGEGQSVQPGGGSHPCGLGRARDLL